MGLYGKRLLILSLLNNGEYFITIAAMVPIEDRIEYILASNFDISCFFPIPDDIFRVIILDFFSLPV